MSVKPEFSADLPKLARFVQERNQKIAALRSVFYSVDLETRILASEIDYTLIGGQTKILSDDTKLQYQQIDRLLQSIKPLKPYTMQSEKAPWWHLSFRKRRNAAEELLAYGYNIFNPHIRKQLQKEREAWQNGILRYTLNAIPLLQVTEQTHKAAYAIRREEYQKAAAIREKHSLALKAMAYARNHYFKQYPLPEIIRGVEQAQAYIHHVRMLTKQFMAFCPGSFYSTEKQLGKFEDELQLREQIQNKRWLRKLRERSLYNRHNQYMRKNRLEMI